MLSNKSSKNSWSGSSIFCYIVCVSVLLSQFFNHKIVSKQEAILWLKNWLSKTETQIIYQSIEDPDQGLIEELLESTYELEIKLGYFIKWFAVRIEPD